MPDAAYHLMPPSLGATLRRLGPARVTAVLAPEIEIEADGTRVLATLAVAGLYVPAIGDTVLVIETADVAYVIGVLHATGPMTIRAPGDLRLQAPHGAITLDAATVSTRAEEVQIEAKRLTVMADRLRERFRTVRRVVGESLEVDTGSLRTRVRDTWSLLAGRVHATAAADVKINGEHIHLG
ncbi:DUF3540 domain-containing protein [Acidisphaera sp. L21]|uniref:DUF3540 domain-containing protein n=1 Tax=Acidisphaera sp. L21 TaxID=1641851 RepID=UPI00131BDEFF|nr:DUF3540 domain-containing protein [Acidisphaera sp. L21]